MAVEIDAIQSAKSIGWTDALLSRLAANSVGLGGRLSITAPANASALSSTGYSLTGSDATSMIDLAGTWNTSGNPVALKMAITNTASGATSKFISLLAGAGGATEVFSVNKSGEIICGSGASGTGVPQVGLGASNQGFRNVGSNFTAFIISGADTIYTNTLEFRLPSAMSLNWNTDLFILRDAANTLALRNAANAQTFNVYNTYTSGSVYERGFMRWASNVLEIGTEHVGASARQINISQVNLIGSATSGSSGARIRFLTDATVGNQAQIGRGDGAYPVRFVFSGGTGIYSGNSVIFSDDTFLRWGLTSSEPAIKRSTTLLQARLADDSDYATYQGKIQTHANAVAETPTATHTITIYDAAGTGYKVLCVAV